MFYDAFEMFLWRVSGKRNVRKRSYRCAFADGVSFVLLAVLFLSLCEVWLGRGEMHLLATHGVAEGDAPCVQAEAQ